MQHDINNEIIIVPVRGIPYDYAKIEVENYIHQAGGRKVYVSEVVDELHLDIELVKSIMEELMFYDNRKE